MTEEQGTASILRCPYHGWSYGLDGSLKGAPEFEGVCAFDRSQNGLVPVRVETWEQFVFVNLDREAAPLADFLGGLAQRVAPLNLGSLHFFERRTYSLNCNWKVFVDNYLDGGYHVPHLHKALNSVLEYKQYTIENEDRYCLQSSPMVSSDVDAATSATRTGDRAWYFWQYPNFMINLYQGYMDTNLVLPDGVDRCTVIFDFYFDDVSESAAERNRQSIAVGERVNDEDVGICEAVQRGLHSRAYGAGRLSVRREAGEHLFHRLLAADLKRGCNASGRAPSDCSGFCRRSLGGMELPMGYGRFHTESGPSYNRHRLTVQLCAGPSRSLAPHSLPTLPFNPFPDACRSRINTGS